MKVRWWNPCNIPKMGVVLESETPEEAACLNQLWTACTGEMMLNRVEDGIQVILSPISSPECRRDRVL